MGGRVEDHHSMDAVQESRCSLSLLAGTTKVLLEV